MKIAELFEGITVKESRGVYTYPLKVKFGEKDDVKTTTIIDSEQDFIKFVDGNLFPVFFDYKEGIDILTKVLGRRINKKTSIKPEELNKFIEAFKDFNDTLEYGDNYSLTITKYKAANFDLEKLSKTQIKKAMSDSGEDMFESEEYKLNKIKFIKLKNGVATYKISYTNYENEDVELNLEFKEKNNLLVLVK